MEAGDAYPEPQRPPAWVHTSIALGSSEHHAPRRNRRCRMWAMAALLCIGLSACGPAPQDRLALAWEAAEAENLEAFIAQFSAGSSPLLRDLERLKSRTRGGRTYIKSVFDLLPAGELGEMEEHGAFATVIVQTAPPYTVQFVNENGQWRIDAMALKTLYQPMRPRE